MTSPLDRADPVPTPEQLDAITVKALRAIGGEKWSTYPDALGAFVAEMDFGLAEPIREALKGAVDRGLVGYLPLPLSDESSKAAGRYLEREFGWQISPEWIRPVADVIDCYTHAIEHFSAPGSPIILITPAYTPFFKVAALRGRRIIEVPMTYQDGHWWLPIEGIQEALNGKPGLVVLCSPHNPTGAVPTEDELRRLSSVVATAGARVFSDEIHAPLVFSGQRHVPYASLSAATAGHTVTAISASKAWNIAGLKCAHMVFTNDRDLTTWRQSAPRAELSPSTLGVVAATAAYNEGSLWLDDIREYLSENRTAAEQALRTYLPKARFHSPESTYFAWIDCRGLGIPGNPRDFFLEHAEVALSDGALFGSAGEGYVRLNFATPRPILQQAIMNMGAALQSLE